jgi:DnaJ family protein C protein 19
MVIMKTLHRRFGAAVLSSEYRQLISSSLAIKNSRRLFHDSFRCTSALTNTTLSVACNRDRRDDEFGKTSSLLPNQFSLIQLRSYRVTARKENLSLVMSLGAVALTAKAAQYGVRAYKEWQESQERLKKEQDESLGQEAETHRETDRQKKATTGDNESNLFSRLFGFSVGSKYYEGGFEEKMSRREAALILGVRESSSVKRIKEAHRRILILNHPDTGGSNYLASKVNEAKELLLKGKE